jgi:hypothetical protein
MTEINNSGQVYEYNFCNRCNKNSSWYW